MMRWLVIGAVALSVLWGGWWFAGSAGVKRSITASISEAQMVGWAIDYADLSVSGFPNRFDTTLSEPVITPPDRSWTWRAPFVQMLALSYRPNHVILIGPPTQTVETAFGPVDLRSDSLRASVIATPSINLDLSRATLEADAVNVQTAQQNIAFSSGVLAMQQVDDGSLYDLALTIDGLSIAGSEPEQIPASEEETARIRFIGQGAFDRPLDRHMLGRPGVTDLTITELSISWGALEAAISGTLTADALGRANGSLTLLVEDLTAAIALLDGKVPPDQLAFASRFLAGFSSDATTDEVRIELSVREGLVVLGPIPLMVLPPLIPPTLY